MSDHDDDRRDLPPALERLGAEVERVARLGARHRHRVGPSSRRVLVLAAITAVAVAAAAVAATTGLLTGEPVEDPKGVGFGNPRSGLGVAIATTAKLAPPRVADPAGGPPWGIRTVTTTRGLGCVQIGRVQDDQVGVVGQDGAFADDGKFHVMSPNVLSGAQCSAADGAGHTFLAITSSGLPASTLDRGCLAQAPVPNPHVHLPAARKLPPRCPRADLRLVYYGLLGPQAAAVTYRADDGAEATQAVAGPEGAYLVVLRPDGRHRLTGGYSIARSPGSGLLSVRYRDGSVCRIVSPIRNGGARSCPVKGYVAPPGAGPTTEAVRTPVRARVSKAPVEPRFPGVKGHQPKQWKLTVSFRARVATRGAGTYYQLSVVPDHQRVCGFSGVGGPVSRDVKARSVVTKVVWIPVPCQGALKVTVVLHQQRDAPDPVPFGGVRGRHDPLVGTATAPIPRR